MGLRDQRVLFTSLVADLLIAIRSRDWLYGKVEVAIDEWTVHSPRFYIDQLTGERRMGTDRVHNPKGFHPRGLAVDILIYIDGVYLTDGNHPIWRAIDEMAHAMHPDLNLGDEFHDSNHLSFGEVRRPT